MENHWCGGNLELKEIENKQVLVCDRCGMQKDYGDYLEELLDFREMKGR